MIKFKEITEIENVGGCDQFMFVDKNTVDSIPSAAGGVVDHAVVMKSGFLFFTGYASKDSLSFEETSSETVQGTLYTTSIKGKYPKPDMDMLKLFGQLARMRTIVTLLDNNCNLRVCGSVDVGLKFTFKAGTGAKGSDYNGIQFEFSRQGIAPSPFYAGPDGSPGMEIV